MSLSIPQTRMSRPGDTKKGTPKNDTKRYQRAPKRSYFRPGIAPVAPPRPRPVRDSLTDRRSYQPDAATSATLPMWQTRAQWLTAVQVVLRTADGEQARKETKIKHETVLEIARLDAETADGDTGRNVQTAHATVAERLGCSTKTVQRARLLLVRLGLAVEALRGRYLTEAERIRATLVHGGRQIRCASTRHLIVPRDAAIAAATNNAQKKCPPTPPGGGKSFTSSNNLVTKKRKNGASHSNKQKPRPGLPMQRLAARIAGRIPWLVRDSHIGNLINVLTHAGIDPAATTAHDIITGIDHTYAGWDSLSPTQTRSALAYFAARLQKSLPLITTLSARHATPTNTAPKRGGHCGHPACDGHGWHNTTTPDGRTIATRCPHH